MKLMSSLEEKKTGLQKALGIKKPAHNEEDQEKESPAYSFNEIL